MALAKIVYELEQLDKKDWPNFLQSLRFSVLIEFKRPSVVPKTDPVLEIPGVWPSHLHSTRHHWLLVRPCIATLEGLLTLWFDSVPEKSSPIARFELCVAPDSIDATQMGLPDETNYKSPERRANASDARVQRMRAVEMHRLYPERVSRRRSSASKGPSAPPLVCVVDDLCNFSNPELGSFRVRGLWHQGGDARTMTRLDESMHWEPALQLDLPHSDSFWTAGLNSGALLGRKLKLSAELRAMDELSAYRAARYPNPPVRFSHGSVVLDFIARARSGPGHGKSTTLATAPEVMFVQLPVPTVVDTSGGSLTAYALAAIHNALEAAAPGQSVIVNLSYGSHSGPHDGTSLWDAGLEELLSVYKGTEQGNFKTLHVVLPAGNSHRSRCHAHLHVCASKPTQTLRWHVLPDDPTANFVELWFPEGVSPAVRLIPPFGATPVEATRGSQDSRPGYCVVFPKRAAQSAHGSMALVFAGPSVPFDAALEPLFEFLGSPMNRSSLEVDWLRKTVHALGASADAGIASKKRVADHGIWTIEVKAGSDPQSKDFQFHAWVMRGDAAPGRRQARHGNAGRQSYFLDAECETVDPRSTMNGIACLEHERLWVVGAMRSADNTISTYSAAGPNRMSGDERQGSWRTLGPDVVVAADESLNQGGLLCSGTLSGSRVRVSGTSIAAAAFTRKLYEHLASGQPAVTVALPAADAPSRASLTGNPCFEDAPFVLRGECNRRVGPIAASGAEQCCTTTGSAEPSPSASGGANLRR